MTLTSLCTAITLISEKKRESVDNACESKDAVKCSLTHFRICFSDAWSTSMLLAQNTTYDISHNETSSIISFALSTINENLLKKSKIDIHISQSRSSRMFNIFITRDTTSSLYTSNIQISSNSDSTSLHYYFDLASAFFFRSFWKSFELL